MRDWLWESSELDLDRYLANDDIRTGYHLQRWRDEAPEPLASFATVLSTAVCSKPSMSVSCLLPCSWSLAKAQTSADRAGLDPELCCGLRHHQIYGYHPYRGGLRLWDGHNLQALEQCSPLVNSLATPADTAWLIHPSEITDELREAHANTL